MKMLCHITYCNKILFRLHKYHSKCLLVILKNSGILVACTATTTGLHVLIWNLLHTFHCQLLRVPNSKTTVWMRVNDNVPWKKHCLAISCINLKLSYAVLTKMKANNSQFKSMLQQKAFFNILVAYKLQNWKIRFPLCSTGYCVNYRTNQPDLIQIYLHGTNQPTWPHTNLSAWNRSVFTVLFLHLKILIQNNLFIQLIFTLINSCSLKK